MIVNPLIRRELRERWRRGRAFWLLLGYATVVAALSYYLYQEYATALNNAIGQGQVSHTGFGRRTFVIFSSLQMVLWALLAPVLTATTIAGERERGLLESLQLSHLTPAQIIAGKLGAALLFILLLLVISFPCSALCFLLGGIGLSDYLISLIFQFVTATTCAAIGLWCSSWSRRANIALRSAFGLLILWSTASFVCFALIRWPRILPLFIPRIPSGSTSPIYNLIGCSNPVIALIDFYFPTIFATTPGAGTGHWPVWAVSLCAQSLLAVLLLLSSTRGVYRPLGTTYWIEPKKRRPGRRSHSAANTKTSALGWWEIPVGQWLPVGNPILRHEARGKFRMRQVPLIALIVEAMLGLIVLYFYLKALWIALVDAPSRPLVWWGLAFFGLIVLVFSCAIMGATSLARERENGTWESLSLSLLSPAEILFGKLAASLFACFVFSIPFWPLLLPCINWRPTTARTAVNPAQAVGTLLVLADTALSFTAWGMLWSWLGRRTASAVLWTLSTLFLLQIVAPMVLSASVPTASYPLFRETSWNPLLALVELTSSAGDATKVVATFTALSIAVTLGILLLLRWLIQREVRR